MAKFKLRPELIATFVTRKVIVGDLMKMKIPHKVNRITGEKCFEVLFNPGTHCLQTDNEYTAEVLRKRTSPKITVNSGTWLLDDPANPWFLELPDTDPMPGIVIEEATEVLTRKARKLVRKHKKEVGEAIPEFALPEGNSHAEAARTYFKNKG